MTYNDIIQKAGKRIVKHVSYIANNQTINVNDENIEKIKITENTPLVGTAMTECEISLKEKINGDISVEIEASYNNETKIATYGTYYLKEEPTYNANKKLYIHKAYDGMVKSMVPYVAVSVNYPCSIYNYFVAITSALGYMNNIASLPNGSRTISEDVFDGLNYTYRDVLDDIAEANGVVFYIDDKEIKIATIGGDTITINDDILKNKNIAFNEKYGPINTIVLSRSFETDVIYLDDPTSVAQNGRNEFKIVDNQIMNGNDRSYYLPAILNRLLNIEYYIYDTELVGYGNLRRLQSVIFNTGGNTYNSYIFNNEIILTAGYKQSIYNEKPNTTATDYTFANEMEQELEQASIIINKRIADVDIRGKTINLTADNIAISSTNFSVDKNGNMNAINGTFKGDIKGSKFKGTSNAGVYSQIGTDSSGYLSTDNCFEVLYESNNSRIIGIYGKYSNTAQKATYLDTSGNAFVFTKKVVLPNVDSGTCTLNSSTDTTVNFHKTFTSTPIVVLTCTQNNTGTNVYAGSVIATTTTNFTAFCMTNANSASNITFNWIAIGS